MPNRRTRLEIYFDVLRAIKNGSNMKTHIMNAANVSHKRLNEMLKYLVSQGFIEEVRTLNWRDKRVGVSYDFTPRGEKVMSYLKYNDEFLDEIDLGVLFKDKYSRVKED
jgi:predicted transcriptional regulator